MPSPRSAPASFDLRALPRQAGEAIARRLLGREHYIAFLDQPVVYGRIPKAANSTIKFMLARLLDHPRRGVSPDDFWKHETAGQTWMLRTRDAARLGEEHLVFTFVRNPIERLASFFDNKVRAENSFLPLNARRMGIRKTDSFARVVDLVCETPSAAMDIHVLPQADILVHRGKLVPRFVGRYENFAEDWERLRSRALDIGCDLGAFRPRTTARTRTRQLEDYYAEKRLLDAVRRRYEADFRLFYPHLL